jgi:small-conductance mechanosensitive channel
MSLDSFTSLAIFQNTLLDWSIALIVAAVIFAVLIALRRTVRRLHARTLATEQLELVEIPFEILSRTTALFCVVLAAFLALQTLSMSARTEHVLTSVITLAIFFQSGIWLATAVAAWLDRKRRKHATQDRAAVSSLGVIGFIAQVTIWSIVVLLALDNLGVNITALVAGLGIGGIAVALAAQNILGDLFASLAITLDRPFVVGDFLIVDDHMGSVEYIGIKTTRVRSLGGELIVMSNADLIKSRMHNYGRMAERRVVFSFGVTYQTSADDVEAIPRLVRQIIETQQETRFDRCHFAKYGASSLDFEAVYYVLSPDYNRYMDIQQAINVAIYREFERHDLDFAYPTQTLYLTRQGREEARAARS